MEIQKLSKQNQSIILAAEKGYKVVKGQVFNPKGKLVNGYLRCGNNGEIKYHHFSIVISPHPNKKTFSIRTHNLVAFQKFGESVFQKGIQVRHLDGNSLNNLEENIEIGSQSDNMMDRPKELRLKLAINASSKKRKFSDLTMQEIRDKNKAGIGYTQLMKDYSISSKGTLSYIINNEYKTKI